MPHDVYFGRVDGEYRGENPMEPPIVRNDDLFWVRPSVRLMEIDCDSVHDGNGFCSFEMMTGRTRKFFGI